MSYLVPNNFSNINDLHQLINKSNNCFVFQLKKIDSEFSVNEFMVETRIFQKNGIVLKLWQIMKKIISAKKMNWKV